VGPQLQLQRMQQQHQAWQVLAKLQETQQQLVLALVWQLLLQDLNSQ
jgi:hypothetical protein